ncbi:MAG: hypothetical protein QG586_123 [Pseudomonadota bacterium]|jgi:hypothetical protein|nr:hypothetical protein [Pseudomonadota bacterium]MDQ1309508.1 hypothetical protein [Pseudomonadota bacterium]MDQ1342401.1 hypothetical protein [Pseudomonadota bacterium]MDQ1344593.1 hypothetical protein [Pseudomonadota bacterium]
MRTTLDIDDDVLAAAKELARKQGNTAGEVISALARRALTGQAAGVREPRAAYGFKPFAADGKIVSNETIDDLRDREGV